MTKKEFLKKLEKKLIILNEEERKDILNEYENIINEKVQDGKEEELAIDEFGDIEVLADEILKAYKINSDYNKDDKELESAFEAINIGIKKIAKSLSEFTMNTIDKIKRENKSITVEIIFEIIIKVLITLFVLAILFNILQLFGLFISELVSFGFLRPFIKVIWSLLIGVVFIFVVFLASYTIITDTLRKENKIFSSKENDKEEVIKKSTKKIKVETKTKETNSGIYDIFILILKVLVILWSLPLVVMLLFSYITFIISIFMIVKGIMVIGVLILSIASIIFFGHLVSVIYSLLFKGKLLNMYPFVVSFVLLLIGSLLTVDFFLNLKIHSTIDTNYVVSEHVINKEIEDSYKIIVNTNDFDLYANNELLDDEVIIKVYYHDRFIDISENNRLSESELTINKIRDHKNLYNSFIENLKNNEIYDMHALTDYYIRVYANENTINKINIVERY